MFVLLFMIGLSVVFLVWYYKLTKKESQEQTLRMIRNGKLNPDSMSSASLAKLDPDLLAEACEHARMLEESVLVDEPISEKERKAEFDRQQAELDVGFFTEQIDILYDEYHSIKDDLDILTAKIDIAKDLREVDKLKRYYKQRDKLNKNLFAVSGKIHTAERRLRSAQYKAGIEITC